VEDLDGEVVALFPEQRLGLLLLHDAGTVVRVDDVVADFEVAAQILQLETGLGRFIN